MSVVDSASITFTLILSPTCSSLLVLTPMPSTPLPSISPSLRVVRASRSLTSIASPVSQCQLFRRARNTSLARPLVVPIRLSMTPMLQIRPHHNRNRKKPPQRAQTNQRRHPHLKHCDCLHSQFKGDPSAQPQRQPQQQSQRQPPQRQPALLSLALAVCRQCRFCLPTQKQRRCSRLD